MVMEIDIVLVLSLVFYYLSFKLLIISFRNLVCSCCSSSNLVILFSKVPVFVDGGDGVLMFVLVFLVTIHLRSTVKATH